MGKHEKPSSGSSRKVETRLPRAERSTSVREEELIFDVPETTDRVTMPGESVPAEPVEAVSPVEADIFASDDDLFGSTLPKEEPAAAPAQPVKKPSVQTLSRAPRAAAVRAAVTAETAPRAEKAAEPAAKPVKSAEPAVKSAKPRRVKAEEPVEEPVKSAEPAAKPVRTKHVKAEVPAEEPEEKPSPRRTARAAEGEKRSESARRSVKAEAGGDAPKEKRPPRREPEEDLPEEEIPAKRRKKKKSFGKRLLTYSLVLVVIFAAVLAVLWVALAKFQKNKDGEAQLEAEQAAIVLQQKQHAEEVRQAPQKAFEAWLASYTADDWTNLWYEKRPENIDGRDRVRAYMEERFGADTVAAYRSLDYTDETPVYVLKDGDETLAKITLTGSDVNWSVSDVELELEGTASASVKVATGSKVYCNGTELGSEYAGEPESNFSYEPLKDTLENPVSWTTYTVDGLLIEPELTADPPAGCSVTKTAEGDFLLCLDGDEAAQYINTSVNFVRAYLNYYMNGYNGTNANLWTALAYLTQGTQAYSDLYDSYNGVVWNTAYGNIDTSDTTASGVVIWADNCYSVDVTYNAKCTYNGEAIDYANATMRIYFVKTNGTFIITNYETL